MSYRFWSSGRNFPIYMRLNSSGQKQLKYSVVLIWTLPWGLRLSFLYFFSLWTRHPFTHIMSCWVIILLFCVIFIRVIDDTFRLSKCVKIASLYLEVQISKTDGMSHFFSMLIRLLSSQHQKFSVWMPRWTNMPWMSGMITHLAFHYWIEKYWPWNVMWFLSPGKSVF